MPTPPDTPSLAWPQPTTLEELGATALASCAGAAGRYAALAREMASHGQGELGAVFDQLANEQKSLERAILDRGAKARVGTPRAGPADWAGPRDAGDRDEEARNPHLSSPYKALAFAVRNAEHAFRFYSYAAATAAGDDMRALAEWLATEELAQAARLRRRRRRAYRGRHAAGGGTRAANPRHVETLDDLLSAAAAMEERIAQHLAKIGPLEKGGDQALHAQEIQLAIAHSERAFAFYDAVVSSTANEAVMLEAQRLSQDTLQAISALRSHKA